VLIDMLVWGRGRGRGGNHRGPRSNAAKAAAGHASAFYRSDLTAGND